MYTLELAFQGVVSVTVRCDLGFLHMKELYFLRLVMPLFSMVTYLLFYLTLVILEGMEMRLGNAVNSNPSLRLL